VEVPVLFIHGDDDRLVILKQTIDLKNRAGKRDESGRTRPARDEHDSLLWQHWKITATTLSEFFVRKLKG